MKAEKIFSRRFSVRCKGGRVLAVYMDLYRLAKGHPETFPEGYRFSWIAFDPEDENVRVLFDCHTPKGPHLHIDDDKVGKSFECKCVEDAQEQFFSTIARRFGEIVDISFEE